MTNDEIAIQIYDKLPGAKLIGVIANQGPVPCFTLLFENDKEEQAQFTFQPALQTQVNTGVAEIRARIEINITEWRK